MRRSSTDLLSTMVGQNFELEFSTVSLHPHGLYEEALSFRVSKAVLLRDKRDFPFFCFRGIAAITLPKRGFSGSTFEYQEADILLSSLGTNYCVSFAGPSITYLQLIRLPSCRPLIPNLDIRTEEPYLIAYTPTGGLSAVTKHLNSTSNGAEVRGTKSEKFPQPVLLRTERNSGTEI